MKLTLLPAAILFLLNATTPLQAEKFELKTPDGVTIFCNLEKAGEKNDKIVLLFHQARSNQHEYDLIAPAIRKIGYDTLVIDQRSGGKMWGKDNLTVKTAGKSTDYASALPDLETALSWARDKRYKKIITVGSSYTAALNFVLAKKHGDHLAAIACFSPGEYLGKKFRVNDAAQGLKLPVYVTSGSSKQESQLADTVLKNTNLEKLTRFKAETGVHGASTLRKDRNPEGYKANLENFLKFLESME